MTAPAFLDVLGELNRDGIVATAASVDARATNRARHRPRRFV